MVPDITLTTDAVFGFLSWLESGDEEALAKLLKHPGYRAVIEHSRAWGSEVTVKGVEDAVAGLPSPMYGLKGVRDNVSAIRRAAQFVDANSESVVASVKESLGRIFSPELSYPVGLHCIVGYDWGIGRQGKVAVNLNSRLYLDDFREIGYFLIHEAAHVAYERAHRPMGPEVLERDGGLRDLVYMLVQNEGLAVYSALHARAAGSCLDNQDYRFLLDPAALASKSASLGELIAGLPVGISSGDEIGKTLDRLSGERLSYVVGCAAFVELERRGGLEFVRGAALWDPDKFADFVVTAIIAR